MQSGNNSLKDMKTASLDVKDTAILISYNKTNKLVTALYMVTDIMDTAEPLRGSLRMLGLQILTDIQSVKDSRNPSTLGKLSEKIQLILSYIEVAKTVSMISEMNGAILEKEFSVLKEIIQSSNTLQRPYRGQPTLGEYLDEPVPLDDVSKTEREEAQYREKFTEFSRTSYTDKSHILGQGLPSSRTRIGVQKGSTLMKALSDRMLRSKSNGDMNRANATKHKEDFDLLKKERRNEIILIIKTKNLEQNSKGQPLGVIITDIKSQAKGVLKDTSEKTLQRELMSMITEGVLYKEGAKRWSKYFIKGSN